jgi:hypothetical protein
MRDKPCLRHTSKVQGREIKVIFRADCSGSTEHLICTPPLAWHPAAAAVQNKADTVRRPAIDYGYGR